MSHYLKSSVFNKLGCESLVTPSGLVAPGGSVELFDGDTIDLSQYTGYHVLLNTSSTQPTNFYLENLPSSGGMNVGVVLTITNRGAPIHIIPRGSIRINNNNPGVSIDLDFGTSQTSHLIVRDATNVFSDAY